MTPAVGLGRHFPSSQEAKLQTLFLQKAGRLPVQAQEAAIFVLSTPHLPHSRSNIGTDGGSDSLLVVYGDLGPGPAFEKIENGVRDESAARREDVRVAVAMLLASKKAKRLDQMKVKLGPCHGDAENAAFFFDLFGATRCHVRRYATVCDI